MGCFDLRHLTYFPSHPTGVTLTSARSPLLATTSLALTALEARGVPLQVGRHAQDELVVDLAAAAHAQGELAVAATAAETCAVNERLHEAPNAFVLLRHIWD